LIKKSIHIWNLVNYEKVQSHCHAKLLLIQKKNKQWRTHLRDEKKSLLWVGMSCCNTTCIRVCIWSHRWMHSVQIKKNLQQRKRQRCVERKRWRSTPSTYIKYSVIIVCIQLQGLYVLKSHCQQRSCPKYIFCSIDARKMDERTKVFCSTSIRWF
jgi:hypothetical protein